MSVVLRWTAEQVEQLESSYEEALEAEDVDAFANALIDRCSAEELEALDGAIDAQGFDGDAEDFFLWVCEYFWGEEFGDLLTMVRTQLGDCGVTLEFDRKVREP